MGPREKMLENGRESLSDCELLAVLLHTGTAKESVYKLAERMLQEQNGLAGLSRLEPPWLIGSYPGIGVAKATTLCAGFEIGLRSVAPVERVRCLDPQAAAQYLIPRLGNLLQEEFHVLCLNSRKEVVRQKMISRGSLKETVVHPADVFRPAIAAGSDTIILAHNHPSGDLTPSEADRQTTQQLGRAGKQLGIEVLDHLVIGGDRWYSIREHSPQLFSQ